MKALYEVKLVVVPVPGLGNSHGVVQHADRPGQLVHVCTDDSGWLVVYSILEASGAPVNKLDTPLGLKGGDGSVDILRHHVTPVQHAAGQVLAMPGVALHHGVGRFETRIGNLSFGELLVVGLLSRDDGGNEGKWILGYGSKLIWNSFRSTLRAASNLSDTAHNLSEIYVGGALHVQVTPADVVDGLVVNYEGTTRVLQGSVGAEGRIIRLHHGGGHPLSLSMSKEVKRTKFLLQISGRSGILESSAVVSNFSDHVQDKVN